MEDLFDNQRRCLSCHSILHGRSDKMYCGLKCKNSVNNAKNRQLKEAYKLVNCQLHKNRIILREFYMDSQNINYIPVIGLYQKGFSPDVYSGNIGVNETGEWLTVVYDYAFIIKDETEIKIYYKDGGFQNI